MYSHYWKYRKESLPLIKETMSSIRRDFIKLMPHLPPLAGPDGKGEPIFAEDYLGFNGPEPEDYESCFFPYTITPPGWETDDGYLFGAVKTGKRPYDRAVVALLTLAKWHLGQAILVASDGGVVDLYPGTEVVEKVLGYPVDPFFLLDVELYPLRDGRGKVFYVESRPNHLDSTVRHLARLHQVGYLSFTPPYEILNEPVPPFCLLKKAEVTGIYTRR